MLLNESSYPFSLFTFRFQISHKFITATILTAIPPVKEELIENFLHFGHHISSDDFFKEIHCSPRINYEQEKL